MKFDYDPKGDIFSYFMVSFGVLILTPITIKKWKSERNQKEEENLENLRPIHGKSRWFSAKETKLKNATAMPIFRRLFLIAIWCLIGLVYYRASLQFEVAKVEFDPFEIVGLDQKDFEDTPFDEAKKEIKKLNRKVTKNMHPDARRNKWPRE